MLIEQIKNKSIVWFEDNNEYIVIEPIVAEILSLLKNNVTEKEIITKLFNNINIPYQQAENLVSDVKSLLKTNNKENLILKKLETPNVFGFNKIL